MNRGRPRDVELHDKVIETTWKLLATQSVAQLTINGIAQAAGTSRPAIYRRWSNTEDIVIEAFLKATIDDVPTPEDSDPASALRSYISSLVQFMNGQGGRVIAQILGQAQQDPELLERFHQKFLNVRRNHGKSIILKGQDQNVFDPNADTELLIDLYAGPIYFRLLSGHEKLDDKFADQLSQRVLISMATPDSA